jgi:hypothetical protein
VDRLSELLGHHVQFAYTAWDRIVLNGYLERLQRPENLVHFFREVVGVPAVTPEVLMSRTKPYRAWVARYAQAHGIPIVAAPTGGRKEELVAPYYRGYTAAAGVVCIVTSVEQGRTFVSATPRYPPPGQDPHYRLLYRGRKRFLHYYFYVLDRRNERQPILRSYYRSSFVKQYEKGDRLLRTETCVNNTYDLGVGRRLEHLPELRERMAATNTRYLDAWTPRRRSSPAPSTPAPWRRWPDRSSWGDGGCPVYGWKTTGSSAWWRACCIPAPSSRTGRPARCTPAC